MTSRVAGNAKLSRVERRGQEGRRGGRRGEEGGEGEKLTAANDDDAAQRTSVEHVDDLLIALRLVVALYTGACLRRCSAKKAKKTLMCAMCYYRGLLYQEAFIVNVTSHVGTWTNKRSCSAPTSKSRYMIACIRLL